MGENGNGQGGPLRSAQMWDLESMAIGWGKGAGKRGVQVYSAVNIAGCSFRAISGLAPQDL